MVNPKAPYTIEGIPYSTSNERQRDIGQFGIVFQIDVDEKYNGNTDEQPQYRRCSYDVDRTDNGVEYTAFFADVETAAGQLGNHIPRHGRPAVAYDRDENTAQKGDTRITEIIINPKNIFSTINFDFHASEFLRLHLIAPLDIS